MSDTSERFPGREAPSGTPVPDSEPAGRPADTNSPAGAGRPDAVPSGPSNETGHEASEATSDTPLTDEERYALWLYLLRHPAVCAEARRRLLPEHFAGP